jgi:hypothetical protein
MKGHSPTWSRIESAGKLGNMELLDGCKSFRPGENLLTVVDFPSPFRMLLKPKFKSKGQYHGIQF